jgi:hypothetical protein
MKTLKPLLAVVIIILSQLLLSCFPDHHHKDLRIKTFLWENVLYHTEYTHRGLLKKLKATDRNIVFYYDENQKLYKAEIIFHGSSSPESVFDYVQGPKGITRITWTRNGSVYFVTDFTYAGDGRITKIVNASEGSTDPYNQHTLALTYQGNNVSKLVNSINGNDFTQLRTESFDNKKSPFRMLAKSTNNPAFFPVGDYVFFQVVDYDIPYISLLSENNPGDLIYETVGSGGGGFHEVYPMSYIYQHDLVTRITWGYAHDPASSKIFKFEYGFY